LSFSFLCVSGGLDGEPYFLLLVPFGIIAIVTREIRTDAWDQWMLPDCVTAAGSVLIESGTAEVCFQLSDFTRH
jgi:hypothetical protein